MCSDEGRFAYHFRMIWFFERENELLRIETSYDRVTGVFLCRIRRQDGSEQVEQFSSEAVCQQRFTSLDRQLRAEHWTLRQVEPLTPEH